jgi:hypothetical protein
VKYQYQLVLQWPAASIDDYDSMIELEEVLIKEISGESKVDGHDAGQGEMNIFILTNSPKQLFSELRLLLANNQMLANVRAGFRDLERNDFEPVWPPGAKTFSVA